MTTATSTSTRTKFTLSRAVRQFWTYPSPWILTATLVSALIAHIVVGDWQWTEALVPVAMIVPFPFYEWMIHVFILHWRPRRIGRLTIDSLLSRKHRDHHADPRDIPLVFTPWKALLWILPLAIAIALLASPQLGLGLTILAVGAALFLAYEWCHYLIHTDYKPKRKLYRAVYRDHRLHHYRNEHFWFTVTTSGTADRVLGTYPDPASVTTSPTAKNLHGVGQRTAN